MVKVQLWMEYIDQQRLMAASVWGHFSFTFLKNQTHVNDINVMMMMMIDECIWLLKLLLSYYHYYYNSTTFLTFSVYFLKKSLQFMIQRMCDCMFCTRFDLSFQFVQPSFFSPLPHSNCVDKTCISHTRMSHGCHITSQRWFVCHGASLFHMKSCLLILWLCLISILKFC